MKVLVAQIGARRHYAVPVAMHRAGMLHAIYTDWCTNRGLGRSLSRVVPQSLMRGPLARLKDRRIPHVPAQQMKVLWGPAVRSALRFRGSRTTAPYAYWAAANRDFAETAVRCGFAGADTVYAFNAAAVEILRAARRRGLRTILDQTMAPWESTETQLAIERARWPEWEDAPTGDRWRLLADREAEEWELADVVMCGSPYVLQTIGEVGGDSGHCRVVPYGYDGPAADRVVRAEADRPLRVLFLGTVELRKGVPYLLEAVKRLRSRAVEVRVVGPLRIKERAIAELRRHVEVVGPVPRSAVGEYYRWADLFVLPTLAEGSANVCYEALAHGLPVLTTPNAGSVVRDGQDGFLVPAGDAEAIAHRLSELVEDRQKLEAMSVSASQRAREFSWSRYHTELPAAIRSSRARVN
jgi:glycosyltransferase involved in cell wall biosynthesis